MPAQEKLSSTEQALAYLAGLGIVIVIAALILLGLGTFDDDDVPISLLLIGLAALIIGVGAWLYMVKPWTRFDDLKTPYYTGHDAHQPVSADHALVPPQPAATEPAAAQPTAVQAAAPESTALEPVAAEPAAGEPEEMPAGMSLVPPEPEAVEAVVEALPVENDLTLLEGIGPKSAAALRAAGITTFAQVAQMSPADLEKIIRDQKVRLVGSTATWPEQAALAAAGDLSGLEALRARIKRGGALEV